MLSFCGLFVFNFFCARTWNDRVLCAQFHAEESNQTKKKKNSHVLKGELHDWVHRRAAQVSAALPDFVRCERIRVPLRLPEFTVGIMQPRAFLQVPRASQRLSAPCAREGSPR